MREGKFKMGKSNSNSTSGGGIGFVGLLTIAFIVLKLLDQIDWSWWWVLSPLWIRAIIVGILITCAALVTLLDSIIALYNSIIALYRGGESDGLDNKD